MPREHCRVCRTWRTLGTDDIDRDGYFCCPGCGTRLLKAHKNRVPRT